MTTVPALEGAEAFEREARRLIRDIPQVSLSTTVTSSERVRIEQIWSEEQRGAGHAGRALAMLTALADRHGVSLDLTPHWLAYDTRDMEDDAEADRLEALNEQNLDNDQLRAWYERHGFVATGLMEGDDPVMVRPPAPEPESVPSMR